MPRIIIIYNSQTEKIASDVAKRLFDNIIIKGHMPHMTLATVSVYCSIQNNVGDIKIIHLDRDIKIQRINNNFNQTSDNNTWLATNKNVAFVSIENDNANLNCLIDNLTIFCLG